MKKIMASVLVMVSLVLGTKVGGWGGISVKGLLPDITPLNDAMTTVNRDQVGGSAEIAFSQPMLLVMGGGGAMFGPVTVGGYGGGLFKDTEGDSLAAHLGYGTGYAQIGFQWDVARWVWLRPVIEIGGAGFTLEMDELIGGSFGQPPQDTLRVPYRYYVSAGQANVGGGLVAQFNLPLSSHHFVGLMLKAGYHYPIYQSAWYNENGLRVDPGQADGFGIDGAYLEIGINYAARGEIEPGWEDDWEDVWE